MEIDQQGQKAIEELLPRSPKKQVSDGNGHLVRGPRVARGLMLLGAVPMVSGGVVKPKKK